MAEKVLTAEQILWDIRDKKFAPIYFLMGVEDYYIDLIADAIENSVLTDEEKEFNMSVLYGPDTDISSIINAAKRYPMMSEHQVIIVREAQQLKNEIDKLSFYLEKPLTSTILVICYKHGALDKRKSKGLVAAVKKAGILFEANPIKERDLNAFINSYVKRKGFTIEPKATEMVANFIGTDLSRLTRELDKLTISLSENKRITPSLVERNVGISKNFNYFELQNAILNNDIFKANAIVNYFGENPKINPLQATLSLLFRYFSNLMLAYYAPQKNARGIMDMLDLRIEWQTKDYDKGMRLFSGVKTMEIIGYIRDIDVRSKGVGETGSTSEGELLKELIYKIMH